MSRPAERDIERFARAERFVHRSLAVLMLTCMATAAILYNAALSVPCGLAPEDGLPVGLQVMAPAMADDRLYRVAAAAEAAFTGRWGHPLLADAKGL